MNKFNQEAWTEAMVAGVNEHNRNARKYVPHESPAIQELTMEEDEEQIYMDAEYRQIRNGKIDGWGVGLRLSAGAALMGLVLADIADPVWGILASAACGLWALGYGIRGFWKEEQA